MRNTYRIFNGNKGRIRRRRRRRRRRRLFEDVGVYENVT